MKKLTSIAVILISAAFLTGCPKKPAIVKEEAKAPAVDVEKAEAKAKEEAERKAREEAEAKARAEARARAEAEARAKAEAEARAREEAAKAAAKAKEEFRFEDIHFDFDMYAIKEKDKDILNNLADWLMKNKDARVLIEGHADDRGNHEYNLALGERRAASAREYLVTLGISDARLSTISYGEEKVVCTEPSEDCWWKNRRAHFVIQE